ncbi:MAG: glycoside hydrolase family 53 protein [Bacteroidota bacterium]
MGKRSTIFLIGFGLLFAAMGCVEEKGRVNDQGAEDPFYFGADLSYVNQVLDHGGVYKDQQLVTNPYQIFKDHGANLVRFRLWHNPEWTKEVYGNDGEQLYNDLYDVERAIRLSHEQGMSVLLDFHFSDRWADPGKQEIPKAWSAITSLSVLQDSVYRYTHRVLTYLKSKDLMPELIQLGNETNCGMLYTDAAPEFPACNVCQGAWSSFGKIVQAGIEAVRDVSASSSVKAKIILHVADPKNVEWWFDHLASEGNVKDFDVIGFSYYPLWHNTISPDKLSDAVASFRNKYHKEIMILETAYPWTTLGNDSYNNIFSGSISLPGYPFTTQGQFDILKKITQEVMDGGGKGVIYWEPGWITSDLKDLWGRGSAWENNTFFDFNGNVQLPIDYMKFEYNEN